MLFTPDGSSGVEQTLLVADVFYAKGIGMIEQKLYSPIRLPILYRELLLRDTKACRDIR